MKRRMMKMAESYEPKAVITKIQATSRMSLKVRDNYFTVEFSEERAIPDLEDVDIEQEKIALWNAVNAEVENQAELIYNTFNKRG
jgi:hypothetical protein